MKENLLNNLIEFWGNSIPSRLEFFATRDNPCSVGLLRRVYGGEDVTYIWKRLLNDWNAKLVENTKEVVTSTTKEVVEPVTEEDTKVESPVEAPVEVFKEAKTASVVSESK